MFSADSVQLRMTVQDSSETRFKHHNLAVLESANWRLVTTELLLIFGVLTERLPVDAICRKMEREKETGRKCLHFPVI